MVIDVTLHERNCPSCGTRPTGAEKLSAKKRAEAMDLESLVSAWNGFFKERVFFSYERCPNCGLLYAPVFFTRPQLEKLYSQMPPNMDGVPTEALRKTQRGYFEMLKKHSGLRGGYIEIGPDVGFFIENCVREGNFDQYFLFEPNRAVEAVLAGVMNGASSHISHDMFGFSELPDAAASTAVMVHVLDHLLEPVEILTELRQKLTPGARLLIVTHDELSLLRKFIGAKWPAFCLQHPQIYNPASITLLLKKSGYDVIEVAKTVNYFPLSFLAKHALWAAGVKVQHIPPFMDITLGLKLGNIVTVATPA